MVTSENAKEKRKLVSQLTLILFKTIQNKSVSSLVVMEILNSLKTDSLWALESRLSLCVSLSTLHSNMM